MLSWSMKMRPNQITPERSKSLLSNASKPWKWRSTAKTTIFGASSRFQLLVDRRGKLVWSVNHPYCFQRTLTLSSAGLVFSSRILMTSAVDCCRPV